MSFPRYPRYKPSGVEWLGEVPEHWQVVALRRVIQRIEQGWSPECFGHPAGSDEWGVVKAGCVNHGVFTESENKALPPELPPVPQYEIRPGDLLMSRASGSPELIGSMAHIVTVRRKLMLSDKIFRVHAEPTVDPRFLAFVMASRALRSQIERAISGADGLANNLPQASLLAFVATLPAPVEQRGIAVFLDRETAKIDALVAEQERLIELLKEKRQAVISHAVTKGLNPTAPMRPSGVEWLGEVPAHWHLCKMKWVAKMESGHTPDKKIPEYWDGGDIPWVSLNDTAYLKDHEYISQTAFSITAAGVANSSAHLLPERAVVFSRDATIGRCAITTRPMAVSQHFIAWICGERIVPEYLLLRLRSMAKELDTLTTGATIKTIGMPEVRTLVTPVPPVEEQMRIVAWCSHQQGQVDALSGVATRAIELLQERRTALISAAVTGQIDVRAAAKRSAS